MKNSVTDHEVIETLRTHGAMGADELANRVETFKHLVFPVIGNLLKQGYVQKKDTGNGAPVFELGPKTFEISAIQPEPIPATPKHKPAEGQETSRPAVALVDAGKQTPATKAAAPEKETDFQRAKATHLSVVKPATPVAEPTSKAGGKMEASELTLLAYLRLCARGINAIQDAFEDCDALLADLSEKNLVEATYIIDQHVYSVNHAEAYKLYPQLASEDDANAILAEASKPKVTPALPEIVEETTAVQLPSAAPAAKVSEPTPETMSAQPAPAEQTIEREDVADVAEEECDEGPSVVRDEFAQPEEMMISSEAMREISQLVHRLVQSELKKERAKQGEGLDIEAVSKKIKQAAVSLRDAATALEETLGLLTR